MEDTIRTSPRCQTTVRPSGEPLGNRSVRHRGGRWLILAVIGLLIGSQSGCSLFVMAGKMFFGDPKLECTFNQRTGIDLVHEYKQVLVVCSTPETIAGHLPSLRYDLADGLIRRLKRRGVTIVDPNRVATWIDDHGGLWNDLSELAEDFDADYILHVDLSEFDYREENSPTLFRGRAVGNVFVYAVRPEAGRRLVEQIFVQEFTSVHPANYPVSADRMSAKAFQTRYLDRITTQLAQMFYDHRVSEEME